MKNTERKKLFIAVPEGVDREPYVAYLEGMGYECCSSIDPTWAHNYLVALVGTSDGHVRWSSSVQLCVDSGYEEACLPPEKHPHYENIVKWAGDPSQKVWVKGVGKWVELDSYLKWEVAVEHFVGEHPPKPQIKVGEVWVNEPEHEPLQAGQNYYVPRMCSVLPVSRMSWSGSDIALSCLKRGLVHLTEEAAIEHAKALILVSGGQYD